jgi:signal transduction histidine kinase
MLSSYKSDSTEVIIKNKSNRLVKVQTEKKIALQRVLQELMVNMKYSQASFVIIGFDCDQKKSKNRLFR